MAKTKIHISNKLARVLQKIYTESWIADKLLNGGIDSELLVDGHINYINVSNNDPTKISYLAGKKIDQAVKKISQDNGKKLEERQFPADWFF